MKFKKTPPVLRNAAYVLGALAFPRPPVEISMPPTSNPSTPSQASPLGKERGLISGGNLKIIALPATAPPQPHRQLSTAAVPRRPSRCHCDPDHPHGPLLQPVLDTFEAWGRSQGWEFTSKYSPTGKVLTLLHSLPGPF